jgi:putative tricarboxylic transport membrane protein
LADRRAVVFREEIITVKKPAPRKHLDEMLIMDNDFILTINLKKIIGFSGKPADQRQLLSEKIIIICGKYNTLFSLVQEEFLVEKGHQAFTGYSSIIEGLKEALRYPLGLIRGGIIGFIVGIIPGTGGAIATWISYGQARQWSRTPEKFGTGHYEGLVASDSCNNGVTGGALIPTLTLGIPGSGTTLVVMAAIMINGLRPGPTLFADFAKETYAILFSLPIANLLMFVVALAMGGLLVKVTVIPTRFLVPIIGVFCIAGGFAWREMVFDMSLVVIFGVFGALLIHYGYSVPAFLLSMLLGPMVENNFHWSMTIGGVHSFLSPIAIVIFLLTLSVLLLPPFLRKMTRKGQEA